MIDVRGYHGKIILFTNLIVETKFIEVVGFKRYLQTSLLVVIYGLEGIP